MDLVGTRNIALPRERVWQALNDLAVLKESVPGCESIVETAPNHLEAVAIAKIGPVKAKFKGTVELTNIVEGVSYTIAGQGKGGAAGFAKGSADVKLTDDGDGTLLTYSVKANLGGKLAQLGARIIDQAAKKMADEFFDNFITTISPTAEDETTPPSEGEAEGKGLSPTVWISGLIVIVALSVLYFAL